MHEDDELPDSEGSTERIEGASPDGRLLHDLIAHPPLAGLGRDHPTPLAFGLPARLEATRGLLTLLTGVGAGRAFAVDRPLVLGRSGAADIHLDDPAVSRRHAVVAPLGQGAFRIEDLGAPNGLFVRGHRVKRALLMSGDRIHVGPTSMLRFALTDADEDALHHRIYESSTRDALTGLLNRAAFDDRLQIEAAYARRASVPLSLLLVDVDAFKQINDGHGHAAGDDVLRAVCGRIARAIRAEDSAGRIGGDELAVLARGVGAEQAGHLGERLRASVELFGSETRRTPAVTITVGVAALSEALPGDIGAWIALADRRLYRAKAEGRNRVCWRG